MATYKIICDDKPNSMSATSQNLVQVAGIEPALSCIHDGSATNQTCKLAISWQALQYSCFNHSHPGYVRFVIIYLAYLEPISLGIQLIGFGVWLSFLPDYSAICCNAEIKHQTNKLTASAATCQSNEVFFI